MPTYTVAVKSEADGPTAQSTAKLDDALDWFTNACDAVMDPDEDLQFASITVDGQVWGVIQEGGFKGGGGEVIDLQARAA